tara:strand:+ start:129 stop:293 length:165 start_codon:yes stop_codon:yes gene_type:complete
MDLNDEERKIIAEMIRGAWASGAVRSPEMAAMLDGILVKMESENGGKEDGESDE